MDMILFEVFLKSIDLIPQQKILQRHYLYYNVDNVIVLSDLVESSGYSSKTLQKGSCPYAPLDEVLWYSELLIAIHSISMVGYVTTEIKPNSLCNAENQSLGLIFQS